MAATFFHVLICRSGIGQAPPPDHRIGVMPINKKDANLITADVFVNEY